jgi:hypothetical protein
MASQHLQHQEHGDEPGTTAAADGAFLPVLTSETAGDDATAAEPQRHSNTRPDGGSSSSSSSSIPADGNKKAQGDISAGFSAGSLARTIGLPVPRLERDFRMQARLEGKVALGRSCWGERNWIGICGGEWSATWGKGTVVVSIFCFLSFPFFFFVIVR